MPGMSQCLEVKVLCPARWRRRTREAQGRHREVGSEGSVERRRGARNTNLIGGVTYPGRVGTQPRSPLSTEGMFCQSSVYAQKGLRLTPGELRSALGRGVPRKVAEGDRSLPDHSAAVRRRHSTWQRLPGKARTVATGSSSGLWVPMPDRALRGVGVLETNALLTLPNRRIRDPYVRWCGRGGAVRLPPIPIRCRKDTA